MNKKNRERERKKRVIMQQNTHIDSRSYFYCFKFSFYNNDESCLCILVFISFNSPSTFFYLSNIIYRLENIL